MNSILEVFIWIFLWINIMFQELEYFCSGLLSTSIIYKVTIRCLTYFTEFYIIIRWRVFLLTLNKTLTLFSKNQKSTIMPLPYLGNELKTDLLLDNCANIWVTIGSQIVKNFSITELKNFYKVQKLLLIMIFKRYL